MHTRKDGEVFLGNVLTKNGIPTWLRSLKTIRLGEQAEDMFHNALDPPKYYLPMFLDAEELYEHDELQRQHNMDNP